MSAHKIGIDTKIFNEVKANFVPPASKREGLDRLAQLKVFTHDLRGQLRSERLQQSFELPPAYFYWKGGAVRVLKLAEAELLLLKNWLRELQEEQSQKRDDNRKFVARQYSLLSFILQGGRKHKYEAVLPLSICAQCGHRGKKIHHLGGFVECPLCLNGKENPWEIIKRLQIASNVRAEKIPAVDFEQIQDLGGFLAELEDAILEDELRRFASPGAQETGMKQG